MRMMRYYAPRDVPVEEDPEPTAGPGDLLIRVRSCSIRGTDARIWRSGHPNLRPPRCLEVDVPLARSSISIQLLIGLL